MTKAYKDRTHGELVREIEELKADINRKNQAFRRIERFAKDGNVTACKQAAGNQLNRRTEKAKIKTGISDDIQSFLDREVDKSILAKTHAFKVSALARRMAYEYTMTPKAKRDEVSYGEALKVIERILPSMHSKVKSQTK